ncbi:unnamed protein product [Ambrosiozyma monospora]|uniref:Unnamed protein product n=1 Tax=Ambrosiozyma monospora TaxID=43982 RepID=A0ACB5TAY2_AMBMO|nr:unnamed protein product [Ambrosiozyma monospora]
MLSDTKLLKDKLYTQLRKLPGKFNYKSSTNFKTAVHRLLHYSVSTEGKYYENLFPNIDSTTSDFPYSWDDATSTSYEGIPYFGKFYSRQKKSTDKSHKGRICAHEITGSELVYNCYDCSVDPTCCMCSYCFNREDHKDHNVSVHNSSGSAICDCGDESSWRVHLNCKANSKVGEYDVLDLPEELRNNIDAVITTAVDFFFSVQVRNILTLPVSRPMFEGSHNAQEIAHHSDTIKNFPDDPDLQFVLIAWNDE